MLLLLGLVLTCFPARACAVNPPHLQSADAVLVVDMNTDTVMYELNKDTYHSIASLTKIMTCLLAVEAVERGRAHLDDMVTAQADCLQGLDVSSSNAGIQPGEIMTYEDLLYCALVHSANDACNVLGTYIDGSIADFVDHMNRRADELGCRNTNFVDTNGMLNRSEGHYSCPADLYLITKEAMTHSLFTNVCSTADYTVHASNYRPSWEIHNSNALMSKKGLYGDGYLYDGVIGVKTGFTKPAGYCLVSVCQRREGKIMVIVLGCNGPLTYTFAGEYQNFIDSAALYDWAYSNFSNKTMFLAGEPMQRVPVENALYGGTVALCATENLVLLIPNDVTDKDITTEIVPDNGALVAPIREGQELGTINVYVAGTQYASVRLVADADVELDPKIVRQQKIHDFFTSKALKAVLIILVVLLITLVALRIYFRIRRRMLVQQRFAERDRSRGDRKMPDAAGGLKGILPIAFPRKQEDLQEKPKTIRIQQIRRPPEVKAVRQEQTSQRKAEQENLQRPHPAVSLKEKAPSKLPEERPSHDAGNEEILKKPVKKTTPKIQQVQRPASEEERIRKTVIVDMSTAGRNTASAVSAVRSAQRSSQVKDPSIPQEYDMEALLAEFRNGSSEEKK